MSLLSNLTNCISSFFTPRTDFHAGQTGEAQKNRVTCAMYSVRGKNPATSRMKRVDVVVESTAGTEEIQRKSGLLPPYEIKGPDLLVYNGPTEGQLAYAQKIGIQFPNDATSRDATVFLTRYEEDRPLYAPPAPDRVVRFLISKGIYCPAYAGVYEASNLYFNTIDLEERIAFLAMRVYCSLYKKQYCLLEDAPQAERERFFECARKYQGDNAFVRSVFCYSGADIPLDSCTISKKLKAYNMIAEFFKG